MSSLVVVVVALDTSRVISASRIPVSGSSAFAVVVVVVVIVVVVVTVVGAIVVVVGSINIVVFFENFKIYSGLWPLSVFQRCVHGRHNGR